MKHSEITGPHYWKSLDDLAETPAFKDWVEREFPAGASELQGVNRRNFMKIMAASFGLAGLGMAGCRRPEKLILPYSKQPENLIPGVPVYYTSSMPGEHDNIPVIVETHTGRPTKIEGNPSFKPYGGGTNTFLFGDPAGTWTNTFLYGTSTDDRMLFQTLTDGAHFDLDGIELGGIEEVEFAEVGTNVDVTVEIDPDELTITGSELADDLLVDGNNATGSTEVIKIDLSRSGSEDELDLSGWTFADWGGQGDHVSIVGSARDDSITATVEDQSKS